MAKTKREKIEGFDPKTYKMMRLGYAILSFISLVVVIVAFYFTGYSLYGAQQAMTFTVNVEQNLENINSSVTRIVLYQSDIESEINSISNAFKEIEGTQDDFDTIKMIDSITRDNFKDAIDSLKEYHEYLLSFKAKYEAIKSNPESLEKLYASIPDIYNDEIAILQKDSTDKIEAFVNYQSNASMEIFFGTAKSILIVLAILILVFSIGITATRFMESSAYKQAVKIRERSDEVIDLSEKAVRLREKAKDIAYTNILTGMRNRYGLEEDLESKINNENIGIALFNFDNFRGLNELYGREFGDEFITVISDRIKTQCSQFSDVYNFSGDEFCFVFKQDLSESQIINFANVISDVLTKPCIIRNITTNMTVSGCSYLCRVGECASVNALLLKMDTTIRVAKSNGGNTVLSVNQVRSI